MARIRTIKPEFPQSETMGRISRDARLLFIQLWTIADDSGRSRGNSRALASLLYPYDDDARDLLPGWLDELEAVGCIRCYQVDGESYIDIPNWLKHQKIDKPSGPKYPSFDDGSPSIREDSAKAREPSCGDRKGPEGTGRDRSLSATPTVPQEVQQVFEHWKQVHGHPKARLDPKRLRVIRAALKLYPADELCRAISGYLNSPHHMGENDRRTRYDDIEIFLRDAKHVDAGLKLAEQGRRIKWEG